jgi:hypothetical protein
MRRLLLGLTLATLLLSSMPMHPALASPRVNQSGTAAKVKPRHEWSCILTTVSKDLRSARTSIRNEGCPPAILKKLQSTRKAIRSPSSVLQAVCDIVRIDKPYVQSGRIYATSWSSCWSVGTFWQVSARFERSSWSGYRAYSTWIYGPRRYTGGDEFDGWSSLCGTGGTYDYHLRVRAYADGAYRANEAGPAARFTCGPGISGG